jgi:hypothetical protein
MRAAARTLGPVRRVTHGDVMGHTDDEGPPASQEPDDPEPGIEEGPRPLVRRTTTGAHHRAGGRGRRLRERVDLRAGLAALVLLALPALVFTLSTGTEEPPAVPGATATATAAIPHLSPTGTATGDIPPSVGGPRRVPATPGSPTPVVAVCPSPSPAHDATTADVDGDGCPDAVSVVGERIEAVVAGERVTFTVGDPGDQVLIGDWDCDGRATPGVFRPAAGAFFTYGSWPADGTGLRPDRAPAPRSGTAAVRRGEGCDELHVTAG